MNPRLQRLLDDRDLVRAKPEAHRIAGLWRKAVTGMSDARIPGHSLEGAFAHAYQSAYQICTALLNASGFTLASGLRDHHFKTFYAVRALSDVSGIDALGLELEKIRQKRHQGLYDELLLVRREDFDALVATVQSLMQVAREALPRLLPEGDLPPLD